MSNILYGAAEHAIYRLLLVNDHSPTRSEIHRVLGGESSLTIIAEATDCAQALQLSQETQPDLVLICTHMPKLNGFETTRQIKHRFPHIKVVIVGESDHPANLLTAMQIGAQGYLFKQLAPTDWVTYLHTLLDLNLELPRDLVSRLFQFGKQDDANRSASPDVLTLREREILSFVVNGFTNQDIAKSLYLSINTVKNHLKNILTKLSLNNRVQLSAYAVRHGLHDGSHLKLHSVAK